jgi:hypothetical protein
MNMLENLPLEVQKELSVAISGIGNVIADTNRRLLELGFRDYAAVAGSLFYNDPDQFCDVPCLSLVVYPLTEEDHDGPGFVAAEEETTVAIYSPVTQAAEFRTLTATHLSLRTCTRRKKGKRCRPARDDELVLICKEVPFSGKVSAYLCLPSAAD